MLLRVRGVHERVQGREGELFDKVCNARKRGNKGSMVEWQGGVWHGHALVKWSSLLLRQARAKCEVSVGVL